MFAKETRTSPWQAFGAHQHPSTFPRSSGNAAIRCGCVTIHSRYLRITVSRSPSFPISNGFPHFDGLPIYTSCFARLQCTTWRTGDAGNDAPPAVEFSVDSISYFGCGARLPASPLIWLFAEGIPPTRLAISTETRRKRSGYSSMIA